jgi:predicted dehydrogenase
MATEHRALVVGCGNIGALYDLEDDKRVWTHAKAFSLRPGTRISFYDTDPQKAAQVASKYAAATESTLDGSVLSKYDIVSITSPTPTHCTLLQMALAARVPVVICEKPVSNELQELELLEQLYRSSNSKVLVNYIRRFQPAFIQLREELSKTDPAAIKQLLVKYRRGFVNNASHAIDLIEFLFDRKLAVEDLKVMHAEFDAFENDPTLSGSCLLGNTPVIFNGITGVSYPVFEIEIFLADAQIVICHSGDEIRCYYSNEQGQLVEHAQKRVTAIIDKYMIPVLDRAYDCLENGAEDNFLSSLDRNRRVLQGIHAIIHS